MKKACCIGIFSFLCAAAVCGQERGEEVVTLMKQSETIAGHWNQIRQLENQIQNAENQIDSLRNAWREVCENYLEGEYGTREGFNELLRLTIREIDGEDLYRRLEKALKDIPENGSRPSPVPSEERKSKPEKEPGPIQDPLQDEKPIVEDDENGLKEPERKDGIGKDGSGLSINGLEGKIGGGQKK